MPLEPVEDALGNPITPAAPLTPKTKLVPVEGAFRGERLPIAGTDREGRHIFEMPWSKEQKVYVGNNPDGGLPLYYKKSENGFDFDGHLDDGLRQGDSGLMPRIHGQSNLAEPPNEPDDSEPFPLLRKPSTLSALKSRNPEKFKQAKELLSQADRADMEGTDIDPGQGEYYRTQAHDLLTSIMPKGGYSKHASQAEQLERGLLRQTPPHVVSPRGHVTFLPTPLPRTDIGRDTPADESALAAEHQRARVAFEKAKLKVDLGNNSAGRLTDRFVGGINSVTGAVARPFLPEEISDELVRGRAARNVALDSEGGPIERTVGGAVQSVGTMVGAAPVIALAGPAAAPAAFAGAAGLSTANSSYTEGKDQGLTPGESLTHAAMQGGAEATGSLLFSKILKLPGLEGALTRGLGQPVGEATRKKIVGLAVAKVLKAGGEETLEEIPTAVVQNLAARLTVAPGRAPLTLDEAADIVAQSFIAGSGMNVPSAGLDAVQGIRQSNYNRTADKAISEYKLPDFQPAPPTTSEATTAAQPITPVRPEPPSFGKRHSIVTFTDTDGTERTGIISATNGPILSILTDNGATVLKKLDSLKPFAGQATFAPGDTVTMKASGVAGTIAGVNPDGSYRVVGPGGVGRKAFAFQLEAAQAKPVETPAEANTPAAEPTEAPAQPEVSKVSAQRALSDYVSAKDYNNPRRAELRDMDQQYLRLKSEADAERQAERRADAAEAGKQTREANAAEREAAQQEIAAGKITSDNVRFAPMSALEPELRSRIVAEAKRLVSETSAPAALDALNRIIKGEGDTSATVEAQKQRIITKLLGQEQQNGVQAQRSAPRPADPIVELLLKPQAERQAEFDKAIKQHGVGALHPLLALAKSEAAEELNQGRDIDEEVRQPTREEIRSKLAEIADRVGVSLEGRTATTKPAAVADTTTNDDSFDFGANAVEPEATAPASTDTMSVKRTPPQPEPIPQPAEQPGDSAPPVKPGFVRFYHGGVSGDSGKRWLSPDQTYAEGYAAKSKDATVQYVDIPKNDPRLQKAFDDEGTDQEAPFVSFEADDELARQLQPLDTKATEPAPIAKRPLKTTPVAMPEAAVDAVRTQATPETTSESAHESASPGDATGAQKATDTVSVKFTALPKRPLKTLAGRYRDETGHDLGEVGVKPTAEQAEVAKLFTDRGLKVEFFKSPSGLAANSFHDPASDVTYLNSDLSAENSLYYMAGHEFSHASGADQRLADLPADILEAAKQRYAEGANPSYLKKLQADESLWQREAVARYMGEVFADPELRAKIRTEHPTLWEKIVDFVRSLFKEEPALPPHVQRVLDEFAPPPKTRTESTAEATNPTNDTTPPKEPPTSKPSGSTGDRYDRYSGFANPLKGTDTGELGQAVNDAMGPNPKPKWNRDQLTGDASAKFKADPEAARAEIEEALASGQPLSKEQTALANIVLSSLATKALNSGTAADLEDFAKLKRAYTLQRSEAGSTLAAGKENLFATPAGRQTLIAEELVELTPSERKNMDKLTAALRSGDAPRGGLWFGDQPSVTESAEFRRWFGESRVVDKDGKPLRVYHGTDKDFSIFNNPHAADLEGNWNMFSDSAEYSNKFAMTGRGDNVKPVYLKITKPFDLSHIAPRGGDARVKLLKALERAGVDTTELSKSLPYESNLYQIVHRKGSRSKLVAELKSAGFDGIKMPDAHSGVESMTYVTFEPTQIKSAIGNRGTFDPNEPSILLGDRPPIGTDTPAFKKWFRKSKVTDAEGNPLRVFHGSRRTDRFTTSKFDPKRATSGPMAFFTSDPEIASSYANNKNDTSLEQPETYAEQFKLKVKGARKPVNIDRAWWGLSPEQRSSIAKLAPRIGIDNDTGSEIVLHDEDHTSGPGGYEWALKEHRGNHLATLVDQWLDSGNLFNQEERFLHVMKLVGLDGVEYHDPYAEHPGVFPVYLSIQNPLDATNLPAEVREAIAEASKRKRGKQGTGADQWDKRYVSGPQFMDRLAEDEKNGTSHAWTSIPDWVTAAIKSLGYDGIRDRGGKNGGTGHDVWIPFAPTQIKSSTGNKGTFSSENPSILLGDNPAPVWKSNILESLKTWQPKGTPGQLLAHIEKTKGAKDQAKWIGLDDFLKDKPSVTKAEVEQFVRDNAVEVEEVTKANTNENAKKELRQALATAEAIGDAGEADRLHEALNSLADDSTKYHNYQLPGGSNYKELLLTKPFKKDAVARTNELEAKEKLTPAENDELQKIYSGDYGPAGAYKSSHFDEPNILAHVRFNDRTDADGKKTLFVEEVQSDWHQQGRSSGYDTPERREKLEAAKARLKEILPKVNEILKENDNLGFDSVSEARAAVYESADYAERWEIDGGQNPILDEYRSLRSEANEGKPVPDAPFKQTWPMLAVKRMIRYAADNGFDQIAWTTGEQQADRYDLSRTLNDITLHGTGDNLQLSATDKSDRKVIDMRHTTREGLADIIGKEAAEKLLEQPEPDTKNPYAARRLIGQELKVGGEGMKGFYDKILPAEVNKFVKRWNAKVGTTQIDTGKSKKDYKLEQTSNRHNWAIREFDDSVDQWLTESLHDTKEEADAHLAELTSGQQTMVHSLPITESMKADAAQGMLLFADDPLTKVLGEKTPEEKAKVTTAKRSLKKPTTKQAAEAELKRLEAEIAERQKKFKARMEQIGVLPKDAAGYAKLAADPVATRKAIIEMRAHKSNAPEKLLEYWYNAILSGPVTHSKNVLGNVINGTWTGLEGLAKMGIEVGTLQKSPKAAVNELRSFWAGAIPGILEGGRHARSAFSTEVSPLATKIGGPQVSALEGTEGVASIPGRLGRVIRLPKRVMLATDEFFKTVAVNLTVGVEAHRIAHEEGLEGVAAAKRQAELTADPTSPAWERAYQTALEVTFQEEGGEFRKNVKGAVTAVRKIAPTMSRFLIPFTNIAINGAAQTVQRSPLGIAYMLAHAYDNWKNKRHALTGMSDDLAKQAVGLMLTSFVYSAVGDDDEKKFAITGKNSKEHPYAIRIGNRYYTYSGIEPLASFLGLVADGVESWKQNGSAVSLIGDTLKSAGTQAAEKPLLGAVSDAAKLLTSEQGYDMSAEGAVNAATEWAARFGGSFVPAILKAPERATRDVTPERKQWGKLGTSERYEQLADRTLARTDLGLIEEAAKRDKWGRTYQETVIEGSPITDTLFRMFSPTKVSQYQPHPGDRLLAAWNRTNPDAEVSIAPLSPYYEVNGRKRYLTDVQYGTLVELTGKVADRMFQESNYDPANPTAEQIDALKDGFVAAADAARDHMRRTIGSGYRKELDVEATAKALRLEAREKALKKLETDLRSKKPEESAEEYAEHKADWLRQREQIRAFLKRTARPLKTFSSVAVENR